MTADVLFVIIFFGIPANTMFWFPALMWMLEKIDDRKRSR